MHGLKLSRDDVTSFHTADRQHNAFPPAQPHSFLAKTWRRVSCQTSYQPQPQQHIYSTQNQLLLSLNLTPIHTYYPYTSSHLFLLEVCHSMPALPPHVGALARRALLTAGPALAQPHMHSLSRRALGVNHTQGVTLGVIGAYIVIIAILWNVPYVRWVLWPFKVPPLLHLHLEPRSSRD
jgi:hypothetical protein